MKKLLLITMVLWCSVSQAADDIDTLTDHQNRLYVEVKHIEAVIKDLRADIERLKIDRGSISSGIMTLKAYKDSDNAYVESVVNQVKEK